MNNPLVSEFSLAPPAPTAPTAPQPTRSPANSNHSSFSPSIPPPHQILVNVRPIRHPLPDPQPHTQHPPPGIRADIDACLSAVEEAYAHRNKPQQNFIPLQRSRLQEQPIHRIDSNIVMDYVATVYRDYSIRNRFGHFDPASRSRRTHTQHTHAEGTGRVLTEREEAPMATRREEVRVSAAGVEEGRRESLRRQERTSSSRPSKQYLNVTQESKLARRDASFSSHRKGPVPTRGHHPTFSLYEDTASPVNHLRPTSRLPLSSTKRSQLVGRAREDFRYCLNCERPVLSLNSDFHEQYECPNFEQLHSLGFRGLADLADRKADRMKEELKGKLRALREETGGGQTRAENIVGSMVQLMEECAREERNDAASIKEEIREEQRRLKYNLFSESQNNLYAQAVELTHKLHWLQETALRLRQEQERTNESNKSEQRRAVDFLRHTQTHHQYSPVANLHPHLHRRV